MTFGKWMDGTHDSPEQIKRLERARTAECTPLEVSDTGGKFSGSRSYYVTTLDSCRCGDFRARRLPCKHIYRLAIELGFIGVSAVSDETKIKTPLPKDSYSLREMIVKLELCSDDVQKSFHHFLYEALFHSKKVSKVSLDDETLLDVGLLCAVDEPPDVILPRSNLFREALTSAGVTGFKKNASSQTLFAWCSDKPELRTILDTLVLKCTRVTLNPRCERRIRKVYTYLKRKYDTMIVIDVDMTEHSVPYGAEYIEDGRYELPDDEVTQLLDEFGSNPCSK